MAESEVSGLAKKIREAGSEQYDLSSYNKPQVDSVMSDAFAKPIKSAEPLKVSFIVGAGRGQGRGKYSENLPKLVAEAMRQIGYDEDKHADTCWECQGSFKYQHDTDKNLKVIHVFPNIDRIQVTSSRQVDRNVERLMLTTVCSIEKFSDLVDERVWSFTSKKNLLEGLKSKKKLLQAIEQKYINVKPVTEEEEELYNSITIDVVAQKMNLLEQQMEQLMTSEQLTQDEQVEVRDILDKRIKKLKKKLGKETSTKKQEKLKATIKSLQEKRTLVLNSRPAVWSKRNEREIAKLDKKLKELEMIEGRSQRSLADLKKLKNKASLQTRRDELLESEKGWFEQPFDDL